MKQRSTLIIPLAALILLAAGCKSTPSCISVVPPSLNITSEKTGIERQIIGDYMELEKDAWIVSSVKTSYTGGREWAGSNGDPELIKAEMVRSFHSERLASYKKEGAAGEGRDGYIAYIKTDKYESNPDLKKILLAVIDEENIAREIIFTRSLFLTNGSVASREDIASFGRVFADEQRLIALKGEWVQDNSGKWMRKK